MKKFITRMAVENLSLFSNKKLLTAKGFKYPKFVGTLRFLLFL